MLDMDKTDATIALALLVMTEAGYLVGGGDAAGAVVIAVTATIVITVLEAGRAALNRRDRAGAA